MKLHGSIEHRFVGHVEGYLAALDKTKYTDDDFIAAVYSAAKKYPNATSQEYHRAVMFCKEQQGIK